MTDKTDGFTPHDHSRCQTRILEFAEAGQARLTPLRRQVLDVLIGSHHALTAYEILARITEAGAPAQPPRVYRALAYLSEIGLVHRIELLNAFVACSAPDSAHHPALMVCRNCKLVSETPVTPGEGRLDAAATAAGFKLEQSVIEAEGLCPDCQGVK